MLILMCKSTSYIFYKRESDMFIRHMVHRKEVHRTNGLRE